MANEVSYASLLSAGGRVARILSSLLHTNLYDPTGLRALMTFIPYSPMGSSTMNVTKVTRGSVMAAATTELSSGFANTALSTGNYDLAVARYFRAGCLKLRGISQYFPSSGLILCAKYASKMHSLRCLRNH